MSAAPSARLRGWGAALAVAAAVVAVDQVSKAVVTATLEPGERISLVLGIDLVDVSNRGIAFGLLGDGGSIVLTVTIVALGGMLVWFALQSSRPGLWLAVGLLAEGRWATSPTAPVRTLLPTSSTRHCGRRSTSPTWRSRSAQSPWS